MAYAEHRERSLTDLLGSLASDISGLFRKEVELAKAEAVEKLDIVVGAARNLAIGAALGIAAAVVLLAAIVTGLAAVFVAMGLEPILANSLSALIVAAVFGGIAWMLIAGAVSKMRAEKLNMNRTAHSLAEDAAVVTERL